MLEAYCPCFVDHEASVVANATAKRHIVCHEINAFEVSSFAELPACGQYGPVALESHLRMHIDPKTGVSLYGHEAVGTAVWCRFPIRWFTAGTGMSSVTGLV